MDKRVLVALLVGTAVVVTVGVAMAHAAAKLAETMKPPDPYEGIR